MDKTVRSQIKAILILPFNVLVVLPAVIVWATRNVEGWRAAVPDAGHFAFWLGIGFMGCGLCLMGWTIADFTRVGKGSLAPWDPTRKLVVKGPYRHVRNPMISGVFLVLLGEALLFRSWPVAAWLAVFIMANAVYIPLVEEKGLEARFGEEYRVYKKNVPRWILRRTPWNHT